MLKCRYVTFLIKKKITKSMTYCNIIKKGTLSEQVLICDIDLEKIDTVRRHWPFFRDRRIDSYKNILKNPKDD